MYYTLKYMIINEKNSDLHLPTNQLDIKRKFMTKLDKYSSYKAVQLIPMHNLKKFVVKVKPEICLKSK